MRVDLDGLELHLATRAEGEGSDDLGVPLLDAVARARRAILVATQQLADRALVSALVAARRRGCRVRVLLEADYLGEKEPALDPWLAAGGNETNRRALAALLRGDAQVRLDRRSALFHSNFVVIDPAGDGATVVVTSANLTPRGLRTHWNSLVVLRDIALAEAFAEEFDGYWTAPMSPTRLLADVPVETRVGGVVVKAVFGPRHQPEMEVMKQLAKATARVRFAMYTFSESSGIDDVLALASSGAGVDVAGVLDEQMRNQRWVASHGLEEAGVTVRWLGSGDRKLHHKLLAVDDRVLVAGTFNFTASARFSQETLLVVGLAGEDSPEQRHLVGAVSREIDRLISAARGGTGPPA